VSRLPNDLSCDFSTYPTFTRACGKRGAWCFVQKLRSFGGSAIERRTRLGSLSFHATDFAKNPENWLQISTCCVSRFGLPKYPSLRSTRWAKRGRARAQRVHEIHRHRSRINKAGAADVASIDPQPRGVGPRLRCPRRHRTGRRSVRCTGGANASNIGGNTGGGAIRFVAERIGSRARR
jgi:hypothetical protein